MNLLIYRENIRYETFNCSFNDTGPNKTMLIYLQEAFSPTLGFYNSEVLVCRLLHNSRINFLPIDPAQVRMFDLHKETSEEK